MWLFHISIVENELLKSLQAVLFYILQTSCFCSSLDVNCQFVVAQLQKQICVYDNWIQQFAFLVQIALFYVI